MEKNTNKNMQKSKKNCNKANRTEFAQEYSFNTNKTEKSEKSSKTNKCNKQD